MSVYFIRDGNYIKIGISVDPWKRLASFQTSHHNELEMLAIMPGGADVEAGLHRSFAEYSKRGEWFEDNPKLRAFIENIKVTFPDEQRRRVGPVQEILSAEEEAELDPLLLLGYRKAVEAEAPLNHGESFTFLMTHKGLFRYPCHEPHELWGRVTFGPVGYLVAVQNDTWKVVYAPGLRFDYTDMQSVTVTRVGDIRPPHPDSQPDYPKYLVEMALKDALKNAVYNRKNTAAWLGVYNDDQRGIVIAIRNEPGDDTVRLDVPEEVIDYWRQYRHPSPLPKGVSIEA